MFERVLQLGDSEVWASKEDVKMKMVKVRVTKVEMSWLLAQSVLQFVTQLFCLKPKMRKKQMT